MATKVILDVDTGSDDAVAIMAAVLSPDIDVLAVCSIAGNKCIDMTTENSLRVIQMLGVDVPVYKGCKEPLVRLLCPDRIKHKSEPVIVDGKEVKMHYDYLNLPEAKIREQDIPAAAFYVEYLRKASEPVTIVAVGPLTNVATALVMDPDIVRNIEQIVIMGGGYRETNVSPTAEFNIWYDAEAAQRVLHCGARVLLVPLDATHRAYVTLEDCVRFRALGTKPALLTAELCEQRIEMHNASNPLETPDACALHDALAVCAVVDETVLRDVRHVHCDVGFRDFSEGQTILDPRNLSEEKNCYFAMDGDRVKFVNMLCDYFK